MPSSPWIPRRLRNHPPPCQPRMTLLLPKNYREIISLYSISCSFSAVYKDLISDILLQIDVSRSIVVDPDPPDSDSNDDLNLQP